MRCRLVQGMHASGLVAACQQARVQEVFMLSPMCPFPSTTLLVAVAVYEVNMYECKVCSVGDVGQQLRADVRCYHCIRTHISVQSWVTA